MSNKFGIPGYKEIPVYKITKNLPKHDMRKESDAIEALNDAFKSMQGSTTTEQKPSLPNHSSAANMPHIPSSNRYAGHDALIGRIAMDIVDGIFSHFKPVKWYPVSSQQRVLHAEIHVDIESDRIFITTFKSSSYYSRTLKFVDYGKRAIPNVNQFALAINPFIEHYSKMRAKESFGQDPSRSRYDLTVTLDKKSVLTFGDDFTYRPVIELNQRLLPSSSLGSW